MAIMAGSANLKTLGAYNTPSGTYVMQKDGIVYCSGGVVDVYWEQSDFFGNVCKMMIASKTPHCDTTVNNETQNLRFGQSNFVKNGTTIYINGSNVYLHILEIDEDY